MFETVNTADENFDATFLSYVQRAVEDGYIVISADEEKRKIRYPAFGGKTRNFENSDEKLLAKFCAELIYKYKYPANRIKIGENGADVVIFRDDNCKNIYAAIDIKANFNTDAEFNRVIEQSISNVIRTTVGTEYIGVISEKARRLFDVSNAFDTFERESNIVADLPVEYGEPPNFRFFKGTDDDIQSLERDDFISVIKKCHKAVWGGGRFSPSNAFAELCKLVLLKIDDERECKEGEPYQFQIKSYEPLTAFVERINMLYVLRKEKKPDVYTENIKVNDRTLQSIVSYLESISISKTDLDTRRDAFEMLSEIFFKGENGRYFTPRPIVDFCVNMMKPKRNWRILDPACGSGGFLIYAYEYICKQMGDLLDKHTDVRIFGIEKNSEIARIAETNMAVYGADNVMISCFDSLEDTEHIHECNECISEGSFDLIITNPSYGPVTFSDMPYMSKYIFGNTTDSKGKLKARKSQASEVLFVERVWRFLKPGTGKAAIILPDNILTNAGMQYVRDFILEKFQLIGIVSLPQHAMSHFGGVKTSIVFVRKRDADEKADDNEPVFMAAPQMIGYDAAGRKTGSQFDLIVSEFEKYEDDATPFFA